MSYIQYRANKDAEWQELKHPINLVLKADTPTSNRDNVNYWWQYMASTWDEKWSDDGSEYIGADLVEELEYPVGTHNVKNFDGMTSVIVEDTAGWFYMSSNISVRKMIGILDMSGATSCHYISPYIYGLEDAGTIILPNPKNITNKTTVYIGGGTNNLKEIRLVGVLDFEAINCKTQAFLSKESVINIISCLADTPSSGMATLTLKTAVRNQFTNEEWEALVKSKPKWNISLVKGG
jgi:hypothetical protein